MKILVAEDEFTGREILMRLLAKVGICSAAVNGKEAYDAFISAYESDEPYDLIFLDVNMPEMTGIEVLHKIREYEKKRGVLPGYLSKIIMATAMDDPEFVFESFKSLCSGYLVKPVEPAKLKAILKESGINFP
jgi:two-component system chemotaxis response regulator CheY